MIVHQNNKTAISLEQEVLRVGLTPRWKKNICRI